VNRTHLYRNALLVSVGLSIAVGQSARAQDTAPAAEPRAAETADADIIVTARKRDETSIAVPVSLTAVGGRELERRAINNLDGIARVVPQLIVGEGGGTVQGGIIAIRGISGADANPFGDQAVSFNIDGVQVARASVRRMSEMDISQVEVLKGPQALFFGKNSPGGIISVRTADPTSSLAAKVSAGYEFNAHEWRTDGFISGPITDSLGARIAFYGSDLRGWSTNISPDTGPGVFPSEKNHGPNNREWAVRGTLKFDPGDRFNAKLKIAYNKIKGTSSTANVQVVACPLGVPQGSTALENCRADDVVSVGGIGPNFEAADSRLAEGTFLRQWQILGGLEMNYDLTDNLSLTSVTGYYRVHLRNRANYTANYQETGVLPKQILASFNFMDIREISEEARLTSDYDGPVNFMIGGLYQDTRAVNGSVTYRNALTPIFVNNYDLAQDGLAYSIFGQAMIDILPTLEFSAGGRYSYEKKKLPRVLSGPGLPSIPCRFTDCSDRTDSWNNLSPEFTLSFRPSKSLTVYGSYKEGFLSGGFNSGSANFANNLSYDQQITRGYEGGVKASLLDGALRTNLTLYNFKTSGLQVTVTTAGTVQELKNAGSVRTKGAEFDFNYRTPLEGLSLHGAIAYNKGRYIDYLASCYRGLPSPICSLRFNPITGTTGLLQDLSGTQLVRAPEWSGNAGANFETPLGGNLKLGVSGDMSYSDSYFTDVTSSPGSRTKSYTLFDATVRVGAEDDQWELALIGRNLTDKFYWTRGTDLPFTGSAPGGVGTTLGDTGASVSRGREVMLRATVRFGS
jgi:iron complex outermembrane receptor protein